MVRKSVSIVIPVFNGLELIVKCIDSLIKHVDRRHTVIIVNDCSTEEHFESVILAKIKQISNFYYYKNDKNMGFVRTCNRAVFEIDQTDNDILLLNSDTEVTEGFLEEMFDILHLFNRHGVVAPRSNNATLHTIPLYQTSSEPGTTAEESYDIWLQLKKFLPRYNIVPTCVGFCLLIRRELIRNFGLFDEIYVPGYNEENDFICRINRAGYSPVQANHAYVFHKGDFLNNHNKYDSARRKILDKRYPEYSVKVNLYNNRYVNPVDKFASLLFKEHKPKFLYFLSDLSPSHNGTSIVALKYFELIVGKLSSIFDIYIYISKKTYDYFKDTFGVCKNIIFIDEPINYLFDIAFKPYQIFSLHDLFLLDQVSLRIVYNLLDIISIRCEYLQNIHRRLVVDIAAEWADGIMAISEYTKEDFHFFYNNEKEMEVIYPYTDSISSVSKKTKDYILLVGNHYHHKLLDETIKELAKINKRVIVIGAKKEDNINNCFQYIKSGFLSEEKIKELYQEASIVIYPSQYEGFGMPVIDAKKYNKPVIVHDNPLTREIKNTFNLDNVYFYSTLSELESIIYRISVTDNDYMQDIAISWDDISAKLSEYLVKIANKPVDPEHLNSRHKAINSYMSFSGNLNHVSYNSRVYKVGLFFTWPYRKIIKKILKYDDLKNLLAMRFSK